MAGKLPMIRWFNTAGPCQTANHYMLPPLARLPNLDRLIAQQSYFVIHAPRQIGKTTAILSLAAQLTASGKYSAVVVSVEVGAPFSQDIGAAEATPSQELLAAAFIEFCVDST